MRDTAEWLQGLKAGSEVVVGRSRWRAGRIEKVARTTKTQVILKDGTRYNRSRGRKVGDRGSAFGSPDTIEKPTKEIRAAIQREKDEFAIPDRRGLREYSDATIAAVAEVFRAARKKGEGKAGG